MSKVLPSQKTHHLPLIALFCAALVVAVLLLGGCASSPESSSSTEATPANSSSATSGPIDYADSSLAETKIIGLKGPTGIGMVKMMDDAQAQEGSKFSFNLVTAPDQATAAIINGEADIAMVPTNLAATLYNRMNGQVAMTAINCLGNLYIVEQGDTINSLEDLRGQTIYATGQGSNPQYILEHLLQQAGLQPGTDVTIEYLSEHAELATLVASGQRTIAMLPEPFVSTVMGQNQNVRIALNLNQVWEEHNQGEIAMGCAIVRADFAKENPGTVETFLDGLNQSIDYCTSDVVGAADLCVKYDIIGNASVAESAIPNCAITFISGDAMKPAISDYFNVLFEANPASLGGALPGDNFYWSEL